MASTTKTRVLGGGLHPKLGTNQPFIWQSDNASVWPQMPSGQDADGMAQLAYDSGIRVVRLWCHGGDRASYRPDFEPRPGEFWFGGTTVSRDGNGDITTTLYNSSTTPTYNNIKTLLDAYWAKGIQVSVDLCAHWMLTVGDQWEHNPYKSGCLNAANNARSTGVAGWLASPGAFFTDSTAISYMKNRCDAWLYNFGDHDAVRMLSLGNELTLLTFGDNQDFFDWVEEISTYLYGQFGSNKPAIGLSMYRNSADGRNSAFDYIYGEDRAVQWHSYGTHYTLSEKKDWFDEIMSDYSTFSFSPTYTGEVRKFLIWVEESWGFGAGPTVVPDAKVDINIQGDPDLNTYAYEDPPDDTVSPYPHERMWAFLVMALDPTAVYMRWPSYIDGQGSSFPDTYEPIMEILEVAKDFQDTAVFHPTDMTRCESGISSSGTLDFKAALLLEDVCLTFVLVGSGTQTIDFGVTGTWTLVTYDWEGDGSGNSQRSVDESSVNAAACSIAFGDYTDGFVPGYLIKSTNYRNPVRTTITTEVVVQMAE